MTVGAPMIVRGLEEGPAPVGGFLAGFYACLVGAKLTIAVATGSSRQFLRGEAYRYIMLLLGALLIVFAFLLMKDGLVMLGVL
jgi:hypothetical protein